MNCVKYACTLTADCIRLILLFTILFQSCITSFVQGKGHAIQLLSFSADNKTFSLNKDVLKDVLLKDKSISESNVAVISIAGPFRKGKSFLLSFFLRYLDFMVSVTEYYCPYTHFLT